MPRVSREVIEERRERVWEMLMRGVSQKEMAQALGVHKNTIVNDVAELRKQHREAVRDSDVHDEIGDTAAKFNDIFRYAMMEYTTAENERSKATFLEKAMTALSKKVALLVETGILPKAAQEITGNMVIKGVDVTKASLEELKTLRDQMLAQQEAAAAGVTSTKKRDRAQELLLN